MKKWRCLLLLTSCLLIQGCYQRHFEDGFGTIFHANAYDLKANKCYELEPIQFSDLIYSICTQVEKIESSEKRSKFRKT